MNALRRLLVRLAAMLPTLARLSSSPQGRGVLLAGLGLGGLLVWTAVHAAITYTGTAGSSSGSATSVSVNRPTGSANGDLMLVFLVNRGTAQVSVAPSGWTRRGPQAIGTGTATLNFTAYYKVLTASDPSSFTFQYDGTTTIVATAAAFNDVDPYDPIDGAYYTSQSSTNTPQMGSFTTTVANTMLVYAFAQSHGGAAITPPSPLTEVQERAAGTTTAGAVLSMSYTPQATATTVSARTASSSQTASAINVVVALAPAGTRSISGTVFEDVNYGGGPGRSLSTASGVGRSGATVELYDASGNYLTSTTTASNGSYSFSPLQSATYHVRVVSGTVSSSRYTTGTTPVGVLTYRTNASGGSAAAVTDFVGGTNPALVDPGAASSGAAFSTSTGVYSAGLSGTAQAFSAVNLASGNVSGVDFGFNFDTVVNTRASGQGSLAQAIVNANTLGSDSTLAVSGRTAGIEHVVFMIPNGTTGAGGVLNLTAGGLRSTINAFSGGIATIVPGATLTVTSPLVIDAQAQPGWTSNPIVEVSGTGAAAGSKGLDVGAGPTRIRGLIVNRWPTIGINFYAGSSHVVQGCWLGLDNTGNAAAANGTEGVNLWAAASSTIGGTTAAERNVMSGNGNNGLVITGASSSTVVSGNYVGLNASGTAAIPNASLGMYLATTSLTIGGTASGARNVVSGNTFAGIMLDSGSSGTSVLGNYVGTNAAGTAALGNGGTGIDIYSNGVTVGGTTAAARNVVAGNGWIGISVSGSSSTGNVIQGNYIGTTADGASALANAGEGVVLDNAGSNTVGGSATGAGNVISGNNLVGVAVRNSSATSNTIRGNTIGLNAAGNAALSNGGWGVMIDLEATGTQIIGNVISGNTRAGSMASQGGIFVNGNNTSIRGNTIGLDAGGTTVIANGRAVTESGGIYVNGTSTGVSIGGTTTGDGNLIAGNVGGGVFTDGTAVQVSILGNAMHSNTVLGIDLRNDGVTANDGAKTTGQPNQLMDAPVITAANLSGTSLTVSGYVGSASGQSTFGSARVEIFVADGSGANGSGRTYLGVLTAAANGSFSGTLTGVSSVTPGSTRLTATATDAGNNTSEFGTTFAVAGAGISGTVYEDVNYGGGAGRSLSASAGAGVTGARVELYDASAAFVAATTTAAGGGYSFTGLTSNTTYFVRVVNSTVASTRGTATGLLPVMTWRTEAPSGTANAVTDEVGGVHPASADAAAGAGGTALWSFCSNENATCSFTGTRIVRYGANGSNGTSGWTTRVLTGGTSCSNSVFGDPLVGLAKTCQLLNASYQSVSTVRLSTSPVTGIDFGFNFSTIVNTNDSGQGSLRQFITNANALGNAAALAQAGNTRTLANAATSLPSGSETSIFMIPGGTTVAGLRANTPSQLTSGVAKIVVGTLLPPVTSARVVLDGATQTANVGNTNAAVLGTGGTVGADALTLPQLQAPEVEITFSALVSGITLDANNLTVRALALRSTGSGALNGGAVAVANDRSGAVIEGNLIGSVATALTDPGAGQYPAIAVLSNGGDSGTVRNNLIAYFTTTGVQLSGTLSSTWTISANEIRDGGLDFDNADGIALTSATAVTVSGNRITGISSQAIVFGGGAGSGTQIVNNTISGNGVGPLGGAVTQSGAVVARSGASGVRVEANVISANYGAGVAVNNGASGIALTRNLIWANGTIASRNGAAASGHIDIDLNAAADDANLGTAPYLTANDTGDGDSGGNNLQNTPVLTSASVGAGQLVVNGTLNSQASSFYRIEFFSTSSPNSRGSGGAQVYLGAASVATDASGNGSFSATLPVTVALGTRVTALAIRSDASYATMGDTSEFAANVTAALAIVGRVFEDVNYGGGAGRDRVTALAAGGQLRAGARVELGRISGSNATVVAVTTTDANGQYSFTGLDAASYLVRVVSSTVTSSRNITATAVMPVLTYRASGSGSTATPVTNEVGGTVPASTSLASQPGNVGDITTTALATSTAEGVSSVTLSTSSINDIDFGFNFDTVTNINDSGQGSLRQAIFNANTLSGDAGLAVAGRTAGIEHVVFMISNGSSAAGLRSTLNYFSGGAATVALSSALPPISGRLVVNAQTQPGWSATPVVLVDGNGATGNGIDVAAGGAGSQVSGLVLRHFTGHGINIASGASGVTITGNHIGRLTAAGTDAGVGERNTGSGIVILGTGAIIGGSSAAQRNVIAGNGGSGLSVGSSGTLIRGNYIGVDATGATALGNGNFGIDVGAYGPAANIGGTAAGEGNVISANGNAGVLFQVGSSGWIKGNRIGTNAAGTATLAGNGAAVHVWAAGVVVGGTEAGAGNVITGANTAGVKITGSAATGVQVSSNSIYGHSGLGIDLGDDGTTANDGAKTTGQPNLLMDAPVFASATLSGTTLTVNGYVGSAPMQPVFGSSRVEIFVADASGTGRTYLGFVTADANGAFTGTLAGVTLQQADSLTATATDASGNTSEFGAVYALSRNVGGVVYEDLNYGGGAGRDRATALAAGGRRLAGATVELYSAAGSLLSSTTTAADGSYSFASVANSHYFVRVVTSTVRSSRTGNAVGQWPVQTWRHEASWKTPSVVIDEVGGARPDTADSAAAPTLSWTQCATESGGSSNPCSFSGTRLVRFGAGSTWTVRVATGGVTCSIGVFGDPAVGAPKTCQILDTPLHSAAAASTTDGDATVDFGYHFTTVVNTNDSGPGSLRQAMLNANALGDDISLATAGRTAAREHVVFMIANGTTGSGGSLNLTGGLRSAYNFFTTSAGSYNAATITLASALPPVISPLVIDAQTQPGWTLEPRLEINGNGLGVNGFQLSGGGSTVRGFVLNRFTNAAGSANGLVMIDGAGGNTLQGNWFGVDVSGSTATTAQRVCQGLVVNTGTNQIGGSTASLRNVVSNTSCNGVLLWAGDGNVIEGNYIGTNAAGTAALGHGDRGILVLGSASNTRIGGAAAGQGNVVAGSANASSLMGAVELSGSGAGNVVQGNRIGLNAAGTAVLANASHGIYLANTGTGTVIGGAATGAGNVVAGSGGAGVWLGGAAATVQGNYIGTNAAGTAALANASGIVAASGSQQIGGGVAGAGNLVSGNTTQGILLQSTASGSVVTGNVIGLAAGGAVALPNGVGITVQCASACTIGSAAGGSTANTISGNTGHGVVVTAGTGNAILGNAIYGNGGLGIDLGNNGVTANDGAKTSGQPNLLMDAPVFTEARSRGNQLTVKGHVGSVAGQSLFGNVRVEIFESDNDPSGAGEGLRLLGVLTTGADGRFSGTVTMPVNRLKMTTRLTGTATDTSNNTSEFGQQFTGLVVDFVVNTIADDVDANVGDGDCLTAAGFCSLRAAIAELNAWASLPQKPTIAFELPGCSTQGAAACRIAVTTQLPTLSRSMDIDATTQPGWNSTSFAPLVVLNGSTAASTASGLVLGNGTHGVRGLVINGFGQNGVLASTGSGHVIAGNWIGLDATGTAALANGVTGSATGGVYIVSATGLTVGGSTAADRNVLSGNGGAGVWASGGSSTVAGNHIGTNAAGTAAVGNGRWGVQIEAGNHAMLRNVVSGNTGAFTGGIFLNGVGQVVQGNLIGLNAAGTGAIPNGDPTTSFSAGVDARGGSGHVIGGTGTGEANRIAFNTGAGVRVTAQAVRISANSFEGNSGLAIDLNADGVSANDGVFNSSAPNRGIDQPVFTGVGIDTAGTSALVFGFVGTGSGNAVFAGTTIEIYKAAADPSGYGEGRVFLGTLTADADGRFTGTLTFAAGTLVVGDVVTATATDGSGNTSEFGPNWTSTTMDALTPAGFNAFDTPTATGSTAGPLSTRVAGVAGTVDVVALAANGGGLHPGFTGTVQLTWIDARNDGGSVTGSCRSSWVDVAPAGSAVFSNARRVTVNVTPPNGGTRVMRLKMVHTSSATPPVVTTACSGDALAVIPATLTLAASDADAATAGTARALSNATASGGVVHRAGRPFTVRAEARDALGALMAAYDGTPTLATAGCVLPAGCSAGTLSAATVTASAGVWRHDAVSYAEVGAVSLQLTDDAYAAIDAADTAAAARRIQSSAVTVGRFVPDSLLLSVSTTGSFATANGACMAAGSGATFIGQGFGWTTAPRVTVTARNAAGATTAYWTGALMKLAAGSGLVPDLAASNAGSTTLSRSFGPLAVSDLGGGQARLDASSTDRFVLELPAGSTTPPLTPVWTWSLAVTDASEAAVAGNPTLAASTSQAPVPFDLGAVFHSARLVLAPAHGDARTGVRPLVHLQRWTDAGWVTMTEDRGCVTVQPQHLGIESPSGVFTTAGLCAAPVAGAVTTQGGRAWLSLPATPGGAPGRQLMRLAGAAASGSACSGGTTTALVPLNLPWLLGGSSGTGPAALMTWGSPNRDTVLRRETW